MYITFIMTVALTLGQCLCLEHPWDPEPGADPGFWPLHEKLINQTLVHKNDERIVFIGDSITEAWEWFGESVWYNYYTPRHAYNYGIAGDKTENVIYRIQDRELDGLTPNVTVLMIG